MTEDDVESPRSSMELGDIYFVLFRHKWLVLCSSAAGILAAVALFFLKSPKYRSDAKLLIRYVIENKSDNPLGSDTQIKSPDSRGENIINSEMEILTSFDLAEKVAKLVGPDKILPGSQDASNSTAAAIYISKNLAVDVPKRSDIIRLSFSHPDPAVAREVMQRLVTAYLDKHREIHQAAGMLDESLQQQTDQWRTRLTTTEEELLKAKTNAGIINIEDSQKVIGDQMSKTRMELYAAEAELAERQTLLKEIGKLSGGATDNSTNGPDLSTIDKINQYKSICGQLEAFRKKEMEYLAQDTEENPMVKGVREQIVTAEKQRRKMELENPSLAASGVAVSTNQQQSLDPAMEGSRLAALKTRIEILKGQLDKLRLDAAGVDMAGSIIRQLQRRKELEETNYRYYSMNWEQYRLNKEMGPGKVSNISTVQEPSLPVLDPGKLLKYMGIALAVGILGGIAVAFLLELYIDQTVKRSKDVETKLKIPLSLSIPQLDGQDRNGRKDKAGKDDGGLKMALWSPEHSMSPYFEALRDRVTMYCERVPHKPKLVGLTSCSRQAGVSTLAMGLASALSQTGDGKVLLVDMNPEQGAAHAFFDGKPATGLLDGLEEGRRDNALVHENLYLVNANSEDSQFSVLPRKFANLVPKLKASDYDYIIFDMPTVTQTSITPRLAGLLDMVMMVIEAEKTNVDVVNKANSMLTQSKDNVTAVLNKYQTYVPEKLHQEL
jgi:polysaccharide biosynthesis transport protein